MFIEINFPLKIISINLTRDYFETFKVSVDDSRNFTEIKLSEKVIEQLDFVASNLYFWLMLK